MQFLDYLFECNDDRFFEAVCSPADFEVDVSIGFNCEFAFVHYLPGYECVLDAEALVVLHWGAEVAVFDVDAHVLGSFVCIGDGTINVIFCVEGGD